MSDDFELPVSLEELASCGIGGEKALLFVREFRRLHSMGFPLEDIADALYSNLTFSTAIGNRDYVKSARIMATLMADNLTVIERSRIDEDRLWRLTEEGLAVGEISYAIRNILNFREELLAAPKEDAGTYAKTVYEYFRRTGRATRRSKRTRRLGGESWFAHYSKVVRSCGLDPSDRAGAVAPSSVFGALTDPDYKLDDPLERQAAQMAEIDRRMSAIASAGTKSSDRQMPIWVLYLIAMAVLVTILSLLGNRQ